MLFQPSLSNRVMDESFTYSSRKTSSTHNEFFAKTIAFNDKLQQFIAFFSDSHNEVKEIASGSLPFSKNSKPDTHKCKDSS